ncbi:MAG: FKBP-type peptidyl-prolyl cis-trans isomerase [Thermoplasmatales archaeon]|nr:MAG: FKBP-type peptidyl-prolyl cis-trans isomerase [Thermoplasmatales archaeon]
MQLEKLATIGLAIIIVVAISGYILADENIRDDIFDNLFGKPKDDKPTPVGGEITYGDSVDVIYIGKFLNGTVFDSTIEEVAREWGFYNESIPYEPIKIFVDPSYEFYPPEGYENYSNSFIPGVLEGLIGMEEGDTKEVTIPPDKGYGVWNETMAEMFGMGSYPLESVIESEITENKTALLSSFPGVELIEGSSFDYGEVAFEQTGVLNATVMEVTDENVTYKLTPENGSSVDLPLFNWTIVFIVENDTHFTMRSLIEDDHIFSIESFYGSMHFKVISVNETHARLAMNLDAPEVRFIGQTLVFELEAVKVYKTSVLLEDN